ncbi:hypothetical protein JCM10450v2_007190 [Rhodotorula kratochvilovae]
MLFSRLSIVSLLGAAVTAFASPSFQPVALERRLSIAAEADITAALQTCVGEVAELGGELKAALDGVDQRNATAVVEAVGGILTEITASIKVASSAVVNVAAKRDLQTRSFDLNTIAGLVANLLNGVLAALKPLEDAISATPGLGPLLAPFLQPLNGQLVTLLNSLFAVVVGLLNVVLTLLDGTVAPLRRALGLGPILSILTL